MDKLLEGILKGELHLFTIEEAGEMREAAIIAGENLEQAILGRDKRSKQ